MIILVHETLFFEKLNDIVKRIRDLQGRGELGGGEDILEDLLVTLGEGGERVIQKYVDAEVSLEEFVNENEPILAKARESLNAMVAKGVTLSPAQKVLHDLSIRILELCEKERVDQKGMIERLDGGSR